jgi:hypothetical protein
LTGISQTYTIIDKNQTNQNIFDYDNPISLMGLLKFNDIVNIEPMDSYTSQRLIKDGFRKELHTIEKYDPSKRTTPLIDEDPNSPRFGEPLVVTDDDGVMSYIYPGPDTFYYCIDNITRIVLLEDTLINPVNGMGYYGVKRIAFARKFGSNTKFDICFSLDFQELITQDAFKFFKKIPHELNSELVNLNNEGSMLSQLKKSQMIAREKDSISKDIYGGPSELDFFRNDNPSIYSFSFASNWRRSRDDCGMNYNDFSNAEPMIGSKHAFQDYPFEDSKDIKPYFKKIISLTDFSSTRYPLLDKDPSSPNFGHEIVKIDSVTGERQVVYAPRKKRIYWVEPQGPIETYVLYNFNYLNHTRCDNNTIDIERIYFTTNISGFEKPVVFLSAPIEGTGIKTENIEIYWGSLLSLLNDDVYSNYNNIKWRKELNKSMSTATCDIEMGSRKWKKIIKKHFIIDDEDNLGMNFFKIQNK